MRFRNICLVAAACLLTVSASHALQTLDEPTLQDQRDLNLTKNAWGTDCQWRIIYRAKEGDPYAVALRKARAFVVEARWQEAFAAFAEAAGVHRYRAPYDEWGDACAASGDLKKAIELYRIQVYHYTLHKDSQGNPIDPEGFDFIDREGRSMRQRVVAKDTEPWSHMRCRDGATRMRYARLLLRVGQRDEALHVYQWVLREYGKDLDGVDAELARTPQTIDEQLFEVYALTIIGRYDQNQRTIRHSVRPEEMRMESYRKALEIYPEFAPAHLLLGLAYLERRDIDVDYEKKAVESFSRAIRYGTPATQKKAEEELKRRRN